MVADKKQKFYNLVEDRMELDSDHRQGLRDAILKNQPLQALVYVEMILEKMDNSRKAKEAKDNPKTEPDKEEDPDKGEEEKEPTPAKRAAPKKAAAKKTAVKKEEEKGSETEETE